jgi:hypothetical protein
VSNFSLVLGMAGAGSSPQVVLLAGLAGLLAGALSMAAGEYVSVRSQRELLEAEELGLVFRARGWRSTRPSGAPRRWVPEATTNRRAGTATPAPTRPTPTWSGRRRGRPSSASCRWPPGAAIPILPFLVTTGTAAILAAAIVVGVALFATGATVGVLTGGSLLGRACASSASAWPPRW